MIERVVVTGASRGIGRAVAERLARDGRRVVGVARDVGPLHGLDGVTPLARDLLNEVDGVIDAARAHLGGEVDGLVHAAGLAEHAALEDTTDEALARAWALHLRAPLVMARSLARGWRDRGRGGSFVAISSTLASRPAPSTLAYATSKAGLEALVRGLAVELAPLGGRANAVAPGVVDTTMIRAPRPDGLEPETRLEALRALHPLGRLGTADEVAATVVHALDAAWMTGSVLTLDGGLSVG